MELVWSGIGFLVGMSLWTPFIVTARIEERLARFGDQSGAQGTRNIGSEQRISAG